MERNRIAVTLSFSTDQETAKKLTELIWWASLENEAPAGRSEVLTQIIRDAWDAAAVKQSEKA